MSTVAEEITRISGCREDIKSAIAAKGVEVPATATLSACPSLIASITGGGANFLYNTAYTAEGIVSSTATFTANMKTIVTGETVQSSMQPEAIPDKSEVGYPVPVSSILNATSTPMSAFISATFINPTYQGGNIWCHTSGDESISIYLQDYDCDGSVWSGYISTAEFAELGHHLQFRIYDWPWNNINTATDCLWIHPGDWYESNMNSQTGILYTMGNTGSAYLYPERPTQITGVFDSSGKINSHISVDDDVLSPTGEVNATYYNNSYTSRDTRISYHELFANPWYSIVSAVLNEGKDTFKETNANYIDTVAPNSAYEYQFDNETVTTAEPYPFY